MGDYLFYLINSNGAYYIYEKGSGRISGTAPLDATFEIDIAPDGTVHYLINDSVVYTSTINAGNRNYYIASFPYLNGQGIKDIIFNGTQPVEVPDNTGHYIRLNNVRVFDGLYSDATHHAKKISGNRLFFRGVEGQAVYESDAHGYDKDTVIVPKFNIQRYGTLDETAGDVDRITLQYQIDNGAWVTMLEHEGQFDATNEIYLSPYYYDKGIALIAGKTIKYKIIIDGTGANNEGYYLYENSGIVRC